MQWLVDLLRTQKHITTRHDAIPYANRFFENERCEMMRAVQTYLDRRLSPGCPIK